MSSHRDERVKELDILNNGHIHYLWVCLPTTHISALGFVSANRPTF